MARPRRTTTVNVITLVTAGSLALAAPAHAAPDRDIVKGDGSAGTGTFLIRAGSTGDSSRGNGSVSFDLAIGRVIGSVDCVDVRDGLAAISGRLLPGTTAVDVTQSPNYLIHLADSSVTGGADQIRLQFGTFDTSDCVPEPVMFPASVTEGDIVLTDRR